MKKLTLCLIFILALGASAARAEKLYYVSCDAAALPGWTFFASVNTPAAALSMYSQTASAQVAIIESEEYQSPAEYAYAYFNDNSQYKRFQSKSDVSEWVAPWGGTGVSIVATYVFISGGYWSGLYTEMVFAAPFGEDKFAVVTVTGWSEDAYQEVNDFAARFFESFIEIRTLNVTESTCAYLREAGSEDGRVFVTYDAFLMENGTEESEFIIYNNDPTLERARLAEDATIMAVAPGEAFEWERVKNDAAEISGRISSYYLENGAYPVFKIYFDHSEIVWLEEVAMVT